MDLGRDARWKFSTADVLRMVEAGILGEDDKVELIEGELLVVSPQEPIHAIVIQRLNALLVRSYGPGYVVRPQLPLVASDTSLPEPDLAVVRGDDRSFEHRHPRGDETALVVEVTWTTELRDRRKASIYAAAGVPVYWRVDLGQRRVEVHDGPTPDGAYLRTSLLGEHDEVALPDTAVSVQVSGLLPST